MTSNAEELTNLPLEIRFLGDDPLVLGLWRHLALQELSMDLNSVMSQHAAEGDSGIHDSSDPHLMEADENEDPDDDDDDESSPCSSELALDQWYSQLEGRPAKRDELPGSGTSSSSEDAPESSTRTDSTSDVRHVS